MTHNCGIEKCNTVRENGYGISFSSPQSCWSNNTTADSTVTRTQEGCSLDECKKKCYKVSEDTSDSIQSKAYMDPHDGYEDDTNNDSNTRRCFKSRETTLPSSLHYYPSSFMYSSANMGTNYCSCTAVPVYADNKVTPLVPLASSEHQLHGSEFHQPLFTVLFSAVILPSEPLGSKLSNTSFGIRVDEIYENSQLQGKLRPNDYIVGYGWPTTTNDTTHDITVQGLTNYLAEDLTTITNGQQFEKLVVVNRLQSFHVPLPCIEKSTVDITKNRRENSKSVESNHYGATNTCQSAIGCIPAKHFFDGSKSCYSTLCSGLHHSVSHHFPIYLSMCHNKPTKPMTHHDPNINLCAPSITTMKPKIDSSEIDRTNTSQFGTQTNICLVGSKEASAASNLLLAEGVELKNVSNHDVICGRGGLGNRHPGNRHYRQIIKDYQVQYLTSQKREKKKIAFEIMGIIHNLKPPGRFLQKDDTTGLFIQIDDKRASEKISQSLREGAPKIRSSILTEKKKINNNAGCGGGEYTDHQTRLLTIAQQTDMMHHDGSHLFIDSADKKLSNIEIQQEEKNDYACTDTPLHHHHEEEGKPCKRKDTNFQDIRQTNFTIKKPRPNIVIINYN